MDIRIGLRAQAVAHRGAVDEGTIADDGDIVPRPPHAVSLTAAVAATTTKIVSALKASGDYDAPTTKMVYTRCRAVTHR
jgi:hypothetical protein